MLLDCMPEECSSLQATKGKSGSSGSSTARILLRDGDCTEAKWTATERSAEGCMSSATAVAAGPEPGTGADSWLRLHSGGRSWIGSETGGHLWFGWS